MTAKEELKQLIQSLTPEQMEIALKIFQEQPSKRPAKQQPPTPTY